MRFVHDEDFDGPEFGISDIEGCSDVDTLRGWLSDCETLRGDIEAQVEAALKCETYDDDWMERARSALGFAGMGIKRVRRRLITLGVNPTPDAPKDELQALQSGLQRAKANTAKAQASAAFGRHLLAAMKANLPEAAVAAIVDQAAALAVSDYPEPEANTALSA